MIKKLVPLFLFVLALFGVKVNDALAQGQARWLGVGSLHNFYMPVGVEREHALVNRQQFGLRWPAIYRLQDAQAAKGLWIGTTNFTDVSGATFPFKVIHAGPRAPGLNAFYPMEHKLVGRFRPTVVLVDDDDTFNVPDEVDEIDPNLPSDRMIYTRVNTDIGLTMERRIHQFTNEFHDNYHLREYVFTNTGAAGPTDDVVYPNKTLTDVMIFWQYRYSVVAETRYVIGNATGWGINAMVDRFGDGLGPDYGADPAIRGHFVWHGFFPAFTEYNNIGGPIWTGSTSADIAAADTSGRLGAYHFVGNAFLHIDTAPGNTANDPNQPFTMTEVESDDGLNSGNDPFNTGRMGREYNDFMRAGRTPRHAYIVEPSGEPGFLAPTGNPSLGTSGGWSGASGVGPYTIAPGESVRIVKVEASSGIGREAAQVVGEAFKRSNGNNAELIDMTIDGTTYSFTKNEWVFQGRDSLMQTFNRALANYNSGFNIPRAPRPPTEFNVRSGGDGIYLTWEYPQSAVSEITGFHIYRSQYSTDSTFVRIAQLPATARQFDDTDENTERLTTDPVTGLPVGPPIRGLDHYYYIQAIGNPANNTGVGNTPPGALRSNRYFTQTYDPASLQRPPGTSMDQITIVPNPYVNSAGTDVSFSRPQIFFFEVPGRARIDIYTEMGELVQTINHTGGSGDVAWNLNTRSRQRVVTGVYIAVIENLDTGERATRKFVIIM